MSIPTETVSPLVLVHGPWRDLWTFLSEEISCNKGTLLRFHLQPRHGHTKICLNHQSLTTSTWSNLMPKVARRSLVSQIHSVTMISLHYAIYAICFFRESPWMPLKVKALWLGKRSILQLDSSPEMGGSQISDCFVVSKEYMELKLLLILWNQTISGKKKDNQNEKLSLNSYPATGQPVNFLPQILRHFWEHCWQNIDTW